MKKLTIFLFLTCLLVNANASEWSYRNAPLNEIVETGPQPKGHYDEIITKGLILLGIQAGLIGGMSALPRSATHWDSHSSIQYWPSNWVHNVTHGPRFDHDKFWVNGILHPYGGAGYYTMGLQAGLTNREAIAFAFIDSTFAWEYGVESFVEVPSIQDLILTPCLGVIVGQGTWYAIQKIEANNGELLGSRLLGGTALAFLSPWNAMVEGVRSVFRVFSPHSQTFANFSYGSLPQFRQNIPGLPVDQQKGNQLHVDLRVLL